MDHFSFSIFKHFAVVKALLFLVSLNYIEIRIEATTLSHHKPNIFLASYAHCDDSDDDSIIFEGPSEMSGFQSLDEFQDKHMKKVKKHYVAMETICAVTFICEGDQPVGWTATQDVYDLPQPEIAFNTADIRIRNCSEKCMNAGVYKSFLSIAALFEGNMNSPTDLIEERGRNHNWTFTCSYKSNKSISESITFQAIDPVKDPLQNHIPNDLTPDQKIVVSILKRDDTKEDSDHARNFTVVNLDNSLLSDSTVNFDESGMIVAENITRELDDYKITIDNGFLILDSPDLPVKTKLLEYGVHEDIQAGDSIQFLCFSLLERFYMFGGHIQVNWKNGSSTILEEMNKYLQGIQLSLNLETSKPPVYQSCNNESMLPYYLATKLIVYLSKPVIASEDMNSVECFMPKPENIEDGPWDRTTRLLKIHSKM